LIARLDRLELCNPKKHNNRQVRDESRLRNCRNKQDDRDRDDNQYGYHEDRDDNITHKVKIDAPRF